MLHDVHMYSQSTYWPESRAFLFVLISDMSVNNNNNNGDFIDLSYKQEQQ